MATLSSSSQAWCTWLGKAWRSKALEMMMTISCNCWGYELLTVRIWISGCGGRITICTSKLRTKSLSSSATKSFVKYFKYYWTCATLRNRRTCILSFSIISKLIYTKLILNPFFSKLTSTTVWCNDQFRESYELWQHNAECALSASCVHRSCSTGSWRQPERSSPVGNSLSESSGWEILPRRENLSARNF